MSTDIGTSDLGIPKVERTDVRTGDGVISRSESRASSSITRVEELATAVPPPIDTQSRIYERAGDSIEQDRVYPHLFDAGVPKGRARAQLALALEEVDLALDAYAANDLRDVGSRFAVAAVILSDSYRILERDDPLSAIVGYMRRSLLAAKVDELGRSSVEVLRSALARLVHSPVMGLDQAADLSARLEQEGWQGDEVCVAALMADLLEPDGSDETARIEEVRSTRPARS